MGTAKKNWRAPGVPSWFLRDLKVLDPNFQVVKDLVSQKFLIVTPAPPNVFRNGYVVEYVVEENGKPCELNGLVLEAIRKLLWEKNHNYRGGYSLDHHIRELKEEASQRMKRARAYARDGEKQFEKKARKLHTSTTFT